MKQPAVVAAEIRRGPKSGRLHHEQQVKGRHPGMLDGIILLWFILSALSVAFVAIDIRRTPASPVLKWAFVLITIFIGPFGAFLYVLGCREPLEGLHERYAAVRWRQVLGSTMHCVAGDGLGILAGAVLGAFLHVAKAADIAIEYALGFGFGWSIFQALFARKMTGSYRRALAKTFLPEFLSMNALIGRDGAGHDHHDGPDRRP